MTDAESLFAHYHDRLLRYLSPAAGEREAARDLTQEVFVRVSRTAIPTAPEHQLAGWLFRIARNVALDHHRRHRRRPETDLGSAPERAKDAQQEMALALKEALATLSDLDRDVFLLREVGGLSREEIAVACELTPGAVRFQNSPYTAGTSRGPCRPHRDAAIGIHPSAKQYEGTTMNPNHEVISDFLDGEAFEPRALGEALADPAGRDLLIDFVVLRYAAQADDAIRIAEPNARRRSHRLLLAAAAVLMALVGGYEFGQSQAQPDSTSPPAATRVVLVDWRSVPEESAK